MFSLKYAFVCSWITVSNIFEINGNNEIDLYLNRLVSFFFLKMGLSFEALQKFGKVLKVTERLQISLIDFDTISTSSFKNLPESLSLLPVFQILMFRTISKTPFSDASIMWNDLSMINFEHYRFERYLLVALDSFIKTDLANFGKMFDIVFYQMLTC